MYLKANETNRSGGVKFGERGNSLILPEKRYKSLLDERFKNKQLSKAIR